MGSSFVLFYVSMEITLGQFLGKAGYGTHKNVHTYGAFKGKSISLLLFGKRQVSLLSFFNLDFARRSFFFCRTLVFRRSVFPAAHFFLSPLAQFFFFFFFLLPTFFCCSPYFGCLKSKDEIKIKIN